MVANLTIALAEDVLQLARVRAVTQGTTVNSLLREYLDGYSGVSALRRQAIDEFASCARGSSARRDGDAWS